MRAAIRAERRASRRHALGGDGAWLSSARLRHGLDVTVLNVSAGGALVEADARLLPGSTVELHVSAPGWQWSGPARVLRCHVSALVADNGVRYRAALGFERPFDVPFRRPDDERPLDTSAGSQGAPRLRPGFDAGSNYPRRRDRAALWERTTQVGAVQARERE